ncbi:MAG TPA: HAMP domain-containing sensor histidine kinase [Polyangiaceae bacterium]|nr:HAMP domain-containing sensor histidine kinase [Polyangiaceae bacterium]
MASQGRPDARERLAALGEIATEIVHELRNALLVIASNAYVARQAAARGDPATAGATLERLERQTRLAQAIVDDVMALARDDALDRETVALAEVAAAARADLAASGADWRDAFDPADLRVHAHPGLLARLLHVLYENAVHAAAPRAPTVTTRATRADGRALIVVSDDGPGVPKEIAERIFDPLVTARPGGSGLGLALARRIAEAHGGSITLVDPAGPGAAFCIELPG